VAEFKLKYTPRDHFLPLHQRDKRWSSLVCHRRAGKTFACVNEAVIRALYTPKENARYAYIAPFYKQAKDVAWTYLKDATEGIAVEVRESDLRVVLPNGAWITLYGADNPDALRGIYLDGVILDEYGDCRPSLWAEVILPTLADRRGWAAFIGTPKGKNHFYHIHQTAVSDPEWFSMTLKASESGILAPDDLKQLQGLMEQAQYDQEFECDFTAAVLGTYYAAIIQTMEQEGQIGKLNLFDHTQPVQIAADIGYSDSCAFWFWQSRPDGIAIIDYYENQSVPLSHYIDMLQAKPYEIETLWLPHDARAKTLQTGRSTVEQLIEAGLPCRVVPKLAVQQGIDAARLVLPTCHIDTTNGDAGVEALRAYRREFNELTKAFRDTPLHDWASDGADAFRYLALVAQEKRGNITSQPSRPVFEKPKITLNELFEDREKPQKLSIARRRI
jgi:hypothetical protein